MVSDDVNDAEGDDRHAPPAGNATVDEAVSRLDELESEDVAAHPEIYDDIHRALAAVLDDGPGAARAEQ